MGSYIIFDSAEEEIIKCHKYLKDCTNSCIIVLHWRHACNLEVSGQMQAPNALLGIALERREEYGIL